MLEKQAWHRTKGCCSKVKSNAVGTGGHAGLARVIYRHPRY